MIFEKMIRALLILLAVLPCGWSPLVAADTNKTFSVATYNLWNWTNTDRQIKGKRVKNADKPPEQKKGGGVHSQKDEPGHFAGSGDGRRVIHERFRE
ncbi:hypothetical protein QQ054_19280 [Oscillatoria amoena NRMC-F 0135]|nr:hypothetical protein [Oscillatoria amoena NRMC-F 0135]